MKILSHTKLSDTLQISECPDGFWLYHETRGMNLAMRAKTQDAAFVEALSYYQKRLKEYETAYADLRGQVDAFVSQFVEKQDENET